MTRSIVTMLRGAVCAGVITAGLAAAPALAQLEVRVSPPAWFIATNQPEYYEGHASYWYGNRWHYREGRTWHTYREEPSVLRERRTRGGRGQQHMYGRDHGGGYGHR